MRMFNEINTKLNAIQGDLRKKQKYNVQLEDYQDELQSIKETIAQLRVQFEEEKEDVEKLVHISLTSLLAAWFGTKDEKLAKEKQEMLVAKHKLVEAEKTKKEIEMALVDLNDQLNQLNNVEEDYQHLLIEKEILIKKSASPFAEKVFDMIEQEGSLKAYLIELDQASVAGKRAEHFLWEALKSLEKADSWGTWDLLGGGTLTGIIKHQHIDEAESYLHQAQTSLRHFQKELLDVQETALIGVDISGFLMFADFFFDGFISDFMVQQKINRSIDQTRGYYSNVKDILLTLNNQSHLKQKEFEDLQLRKQELIESL